jgi:hypothetical protein
VSDNPEINPLGYLAYVVGDLAAFGRTAAAALDHRPADADAIRLLADRMAGAGDALMHNLKRLPPSTQEEAAEAIAAALTWAHEIGRYREPNAPGLVMERAVSLVRGRKAAANEQRKREAVAYIDRFLEPAMRRASGLHHSPTDKELLRIVNEERGKVGAQGVSLRTVQRRKKLLRQKPPA